MLYFAYGSNMDQTQLTERKVNATLLGVGVLNKYELKFNKKSSKKGGVGFANICPNDYSKVEGLLFEISNIEALDRHEGYPSHYTKEEVVVTDPNGIEVKAIAYVANPNQICDGLKPEQMYLNKLLTAKLFLSEEYYRFLESFDVIPEK
jgi:cation transport regulator ChaC